MNSPAPSSTGTTSSAAAPARVPRERKPRGEGQWARRDNFGDGFHNDNFKLQFGVKYNYGVHFENGTVATNASK